MKKSIYILGIISLSILLIATIFKVSHLPGASILLTTGLLLLSLVFLPIVYAKLLKSTNDKLLKVVYHTGFISFSFDFIGALFKIQHFPGANILMLIGVPLPFILFLPAYITYHNKRKLKADLNFFGILIFMIYLGVFSSLLALDSNYKVLNTYAHCSEEVNQSNHFIASVSDNSKNHSQCLLLVNTVEDIKKELILIANKENKDCLNHGNIKYYNTRGKNNILPIETYHHAGLKDFNKKFDLFKTKLMQLKPNSHVLRLLDEIDYYRTPCEDLGYPALVNLRLIGALNVLTEWQNKLLLIDYIIESEKLTS